MSYQANTRTLPLRTVIDLKGNHEDVLPRMLRLGLTDATPARRVGVGALELLRPGKEHWMLLAPLQDEDRLLSEIKAMPLRDDTLVLGVSDAYQFFAIDGPDARLLIAIASPLDVDPAQFPADGATFTEVFGLKALVMRRGYGFELAIERSYAPMLQDYFSRINPAP